MSGMLKKKGVKLAILPQGQEVIALGDMLKDEDSKGTQKFLYLSGDNKSYYTDACFLTKKTDWLTLNQNDKRKNDEALNLIGGYKSPAVIKYVFDTWLKDK